MQVKCIKTKLYNASQGKSILKKGKIYNVIGYGSYTRISDGETIQTYELAEEPGFGYSKDMFEIVTS